MTSPVIFCLDPSRSSSHELWIVKMQQKQTRRMIDENVSVPGYRLNIKKRLCELELTVIQSQSASFAAVFKNIWP